MNGLKSIKNMEISTKIELLIRSIEIAKETNLNEIDGGNR